ncbi:hypothetical protein, partial [Acidithiobacillus ferriphilus]
SLEEHLYPTGQPTTAEPVPEIVQESVNAAIPEESILPAMQQEPVSVAVPSEGEQQSFPLDEG